MFWGVVVATMDGDWRALPCGGMPGFHDDFTANIPGRALQPTVVQHTPQLIRLHAATFAAAITQRSKRLPTSHTMSMQNSRINRQEFYFRAQPFGNSWAPEEKYFVLTLHLPPLKQRHGRWITGSVPQVILEQYIAANC